MKRIFLTLLSILWAGNAWGTTYTICASGCDYTQLDTCLSTEDLGPGDIISVTEDHTESGDVTWDDVDDGDGTGVVTLELNGHTFTLTDTLVAGIILLDDIDGITIQNGTIVLAVTGDHIILSYEDLANLTISDVYFSDGGGNIGSAIHFSGVAPAAATDVLIERCFFNVPDDIAFRASVLTGEVHNSIFPNVNVGVYFNSPSTIDVYGCVFTGNATAVLFAATSGTATIKNCIFEANTNGVLDPLGIATCTLDYNCWNGNTTDVDNFSKGANRVDAASLLINPGGTSAAEYKLKAGSPCIGAGTDLSGTFTTDFDGKTREKWDIGAFSYQPPEDPWRNWFRWF